MIKSRMSVVALILWASVSVSVAQNSPEKKHPSSTPAEEGGVAKNLR